MVRGKRTYSAKVDPPGDGRYVAFMIEVTYQRPKKLEGLTIDLPPVKNVARGKLPPIPRDLSGRLMFTSEVSILPNTFPYADCFGETCGNNLV